MKATIVSIDSAMISTMVDYKERLEKAMKAAGVDITELARSVGVSYQAARKVLEGESKAFTAENNAKAAARLNVSSDWLATGMGDMARNANSIVFSEENEDLVRIPILANSGSMGKGNDTLDADYVVGDLALSAHWINQHIKPGNIRELKFIHAQGESMSPTFSDGDVLLVDVGSRDPASHEGVYVLDVHGQTYIKRVRMRMSGNLEVSSDNPNIKTVDELNGDHQVRVLGRVVWAWNGQKL